MNLQVLDSLSMCLCMLIPKDLKTPGHVHVSESIKALKTSYNKIDYEPLVHNVLGGWNLPHELYRTCATSSFLLSLMDWLFLDAVQTVDVIVPRLHLLTDLLIVDFQLSCSLLLAVSLTNQHTSEEARNRINVT